MVLRSDITVDHRNIRPDHRLRGIAGRNDTAPRIAAATEFVNLATKRGRLRRVQAVPRFAHRSRLPVGPHGGVPALEIGDAVHGPVREPHDIKLPDSVSLRAESQPAAVRRGLRVVVQRAFRGPRQTARLGPRAWRGTARRSRRLSRCRRPTSRPPTRPGCRCCRCGSRGHPGIRITPAVAAPVGELAEPGAVGPHDVRMAVVMLAGDEQEVPAVGRPLGHEVERQPGRDLARRSIRPRRQCRPCSSCGTRFAGRRSTH